MQVYAAAIVYNALRVAQSDGAAHVGWAPERLSPATFFPKVATATYLVSICIDNSGNARFGPGIVASICDSSAAAGAGSGRPQSPCSENTAVTTVVLEGSVPRGGIGSRWLMYAAGAASRSYLSGDESEGTFQISAQYLNCSRDPCFA